MASGSGGRWGCRKEQNRGYVSRRVSGPLHPGRDLETAHGLKCLCLRYVRVTGQISGVNWATQAGLSTHYPSALSGCGEHTSLCTAQAVRWQDWPQ